MVCIIYEMTLAHANRLKNYDKSTVKLKLWKYVNYCPNRDQLNDKK
jgi:hypothetical protein